MLHCDDFNIAARPDHIDYVVSPVSQNSNILISLTVLFMAPVVPGAELREFSQ